MKSVEIYEKIKSGEYFEALLLAEKSYKQDNTDINKLVDYVTILIKLNTLDKAEEVLNKTNIKPEKNPSVYCLYSKLYASQGKIDKLKSLEEIERSFAECSNYPNINSLSGVDELTKYENEYYKNQLSEVLKFLIEKFPIYSHKFKKVIIQMKNNSLGIGKDLLKKCAHSMKDKNLGYFLLGEIAMLDGKFEIAQNRYTKIVDDFPFKYIILNRLGDIQLSLNNHEKAKEYYNKSIELEPDDLNTIIDLIRLDIGKGDFKNAKKAYMKATLKFDANKLHQIKHLIESQEEIIKQDYVNGLTWFQGGGNVIKLEFMCENGSGSLNPTGNLGFQLLDALNLSYTVCSKRFRSLLKKQMKKDIFVNIPNALVFVDGGSIGLAATIGMLSQVLGKKIPTEYAFTGEITLNGNILPTGGLKWKLTSAYLQNIRTVFIPKQNFKDLTNVPNNVKANLSINLVSNIKEVEKQLWKH
ncbi:MAG: S16 family serine protease [Candidatus Tenebribacter davisii]|nr:S16 family serine protease [Candidatus Tenebribacter davisii]